MTKRWALDPWGGLSVSWLLPCSVQISNSCNHDDRFKVSNFECLWTEVKLTEEPTSFSFSALRGWILPVYKRTILIPSSVRVYHQRWNWPCSAYLNGCATEDSWLISRNFNVTFSVVFFRSGGQNLCAGGYYKGQGILFLGVYGPNVTSELPDFFWQIKPFVMSLRLVVLLGDWNIVLDLNIVWQRTRQDTNKLGTKYFQESVTRFNFID